MCRGVSGVPFLLCLSESQPFFQAPIQFTLPLDRCFPECHLIRLLSNLNNKSILNLAFVFCLMLYVSVSVLVGDRLNEVTKETLRTIQYQDTGSKEGKSARNGTISQCQAWKERVGKKDRAPSGSSRAPRGELQELPACPGELWPPVRDQPGRLEDGG